MRKRMLSLLLIGIMLVTAFSTETFAAAVSPEQVSEEETVRTGSMLMNVIEISEEEAEEIGIISQPEAAAGGRLQSYSNVYGSQAYNSSWDAYSSNYIYNRLGTKERKLWDLLDTECNRYLTKAEDARKEQVDTETGMAYCYVTKGFDYMSLGMTQTKAQNVYLMFVYSNPQYYFLDSSYLLSGGRAIIPVLYDAFANGRTRKSETDKMQAQINAMKAEVNKGATELEKARIAHDLIIRKVKYDRAYNTDRPNTLYHQSAYSVFCDSYTVCAGYTKSFEILMNSVGIDTIGVTSYRVIGKDIYGRDIGVGHAWNAVCLDDNWYYVDCTWDDLDGDGFRKPALQYTWFGLSEATITGPMDQDKSHKAESAYSGLLPQCTRDLGSTKDAVGSLYLAVQATEAPQISQKKTANGMKVTLKTLTPGADIYYTTDGKEPSPSFSRGYHYTESFTVNENVTVKAVAVCDGKKNSEVTSATVEGKQYTVKFNTSGGDKIAAQKVWPQETVAKPADPTRKGYKFDGWYSDKGGTVKWNFGNQIMQNTTVYAKWTKVTVGDTAIKGLKNLPGRKMNVIIRKAGDVKGYQIRYSTKSDMRSSKKVIIKTNQKVISGLQKDSTYYVQVRAYKLDSGKQKVFGNWSNSKAVTIRK